MLLCEPFELGHSQKEVPTPASGSTTPAQSQAEIAPPTIPGCTKSHEKAHPEAIQVVVDEPPEDGSYAKWCKDRIQFMLRVEPHAPPDDSPPPRGLDVRKRIALKGEASALIWRIILGSDDADTAATIESIVRYSMSQEHAELALQGLSTQRATPRARPKGIPRGSVLQVLGPANQGPEEPLA